MVYEGSPGKHLHFLVSGDATLHLLIQRYSWHLMILDTKQYIREYNIYQRVNPATLKMIPELHPVPLLKMVFRQIGIDLITLPEVIGYRSEAVAIGYLRLTNMNNLQAVTFFEVIKNYHKHINDDFEQPQIVIPTLRAYQRRAVKWMVDREKNNNFVKCDGSPFSGGILADETGLEKTIEMLCCIMENTAPPEFYNQKVVIKDCIKKLFGQIPCRPSTSKYIEYTNEIGLAVKSKVPKKIINEDTHIVACYCKTTVPKSILVYCAMCGKGQHAQCVHFEPKPFQEVPYLCSDCWIVNYRVQCKASLIVVPQSILNQWIDEVILNI
ncbi:uncharacterized protein LOC132933936 [Metopolophium dirhodum]|uniref:uncharacterized protein LOC132933936 n=1 Tax=Metopolophium dirhodum TaxID=44670 RepID=UPI00298FE2AA|nr:uncharacterized protein LOC132933936 [Metopolophium dirhodum]